MTKKELLDLIKDMPDNAHIVLSPGDEDGNESFKTNSVIVKKLWWNASAGMYFTDPEIEAEEEEVSSIVLTSQIIR